MIYFEWLLIDFWYSTLDNDTQIEIHFRHMVDQFFNWQIEIRDFIDMC
jgi:hypothetical protein